MFSKIILILSSIILGNVGILLTFMPEEILKLLYLVITKELQIIFQILGAFYFSFAILNWISRSSLTGTVYNKPILIANLIHFSIVGIALIKEIISNPNSPKLIWIMTIAYTLFAFSFGIIANKNSVLETEVIKQKKGPQRKKG